MEKETQKHTFWERKGKQVCLVTHIKSKKVNYSKGPYISSFVPMLVHNSLCGSE